MAISLAVGSNHSTPLEVLVELSFHKEAIVRCGVCQNPVVPLSLLINLADDEDTAIRYSVAQKPNLPNELLIKLAKDKNRVVRQGVAYNSSCSKELILDIYKKEVRRNTLELSFVKNMVEKNVLEQTEVSTLLATYGEPLAEVICPYTIVEPRSVLARQLEKFGYKSKETKGKEFTI